MEMTYPDPFPVVLVRLSCLRAQVVSAHVKFQSQEKKRRALLKKGVIRANKHLRAGRYLVLVYPQENGKRQREYIGADPERIAHVQAGIERAGELDRLTEENERWTLIMRKFADGVEALHALLAEASSKGE